MKILNTLALTPYCGSGRGAATAPRPPAAVDVLGTWNATVTTGQGTDPVEVKLRKDGDKIVGTIGSQMGEMPVEAEVKGKTLSIWFNFQGQNGPMAIELTGDVDGDSVKGTMLAGGQQAGEFVATRAKAAGAKDAPKEPAKDQAAAKTDLVGHLQRDHRAAEHDGESDCRPQAGRRQALGRLHERAVRQVPADRHGEGHGRELLVPDERRGQRLERDLHRHRRQGRRDQGSVAYGDMMSGTFVAAKKK